MLGYAYLLISLEKYIGNQEQVAVNTPTGRNTGLEGKTIITLLKHFPFLPYAFINLAKCLKY
jgi:hypothetical protein